MLINDRDAEVEGQSLTSRDGRCKAASYEEGTDVVTERRCSPLGPLRKQGYGRLLSCLSFLCGS